MSSSRSSMTDTTWTPSDDIRIRATARVARVRGGLRAAALAEDLRDLARAVGRYLPANYEILEHGRDDAGPYVTIGGVDSCGWTLDDYVIPRLASGLYGATEVPITPYVRDHARQLIDLINRYA